MLDLGTSFLASVERDPDALAIVDGDVRFTYRQWYRRISSLVEAFDELELEPGDHLVTLLQNNWQAATIHWACQFAGIIITPLNWRSTAEELDYCLDNADARALVYEEVSAKAVAASKEAQKHPRIAIGVPDDLPFESLIATDGRVVVALFDCRHFFRPPSRRADVVQVVAVHFSPRIVRINRPPKGQVK